MLTKKVSSAVKKIVATKHHFDKFCQEIEIPGLRDAYSTNHLIVRILWIIFLTGGSALTVFFIYEDISDYNENPTATKVYPSRNASYDLPPVYFGSTQTSNHERGWRSMGLSEVGILYVKSLDWHSEMNFNETLYEEGKADFQRFVVDHNLTTWADLFQRTSFDGMKDFRLECDDCVSDDGEFGRKKFISFLPNSISILYEVPFKPATASWVRTGTDVGMSFSIEKTNTDHYYVVLGKLYNVVIPDDFFPIWPNFDYDIRVNAHRIKSLSNGNCKESDETNNDPYHPKLCADACSDANLWQCARCKKVRPDTSIEISNNLTKGYQKSYCSTLKHNVTCIHSKIIETRITRCTLACLPLCDQTIYEYSVVNVPSFDNRIKISFYPTYTDAGILTFEEVPTYTFESAVSNVGGQLGLWLGLSIVTFVQICLFWLNQCLTKERRSSNVGNRDINANCTMQSQV